VTESSERDTVVIANPGQIDTDARPAAALSDLIGTTSQTVKGPHGKPIFYHPAPGQMRLSAYTEWKKWLFISGSPEAISRLLKGAETPQAVITPDAAFVSDGLPKKASVRFWASNAKGNFTALIIENQKRSVIPIPKNPDAVKRFSGILRLGPGRKVVANAQAAPSKRQQIPALQKELELTLSSTHQLLTMFKVPSIGSIKNKGKVLVLQLSIDDYLFGQPGLFKQPVVNPSSSGGERT
jgi:hypothetical protein